MSANTWTARRIYLSGFCQDCRFRNAGSFADSVCKSEAIHLTMKDYTAAINTCKIYLCMSSHALCSQLQLQLQSLPLLS